MIIGPIKLPLDTGSEANLAYRWYLDDGTISVPFTVGIARLAGLNYFTITTTPPSNSSLVVLYDTTDPTNTTEFPFTNTGALIFGPLTLGAQDVSGGVNLSVALNVGTVLANVTFFWIVNGVAQAPIVTGITQPDPDYPVFRINAIPPTSAEEMVVYDVTDLGNWNLGNYIELLFGAQLNVSQSLADLRNLCAAYMEVDPTAFIVNGTDLFLIAANNARMQGEQLNSFEFCRGQWTLTLDGNNGASLDDAVMTYGESYIAKVKEVTALIRQGLDGRYTPLDFTRVDIAVERDRTTLEFQDYFYPTVRYPSDADLRARRTRSTVVQRGRQLFIHPTFISTLDDQVNLTIEGIGWLRPYGSLGVVTGPEDFFVEFGYEYLQWAIICNLNKLFKKYVPRQEGNLPEPVKDRDDAWHRFLIWDSYQVDSNVTRSR